MLTCTQTSLISQSIRAPTMLTSTQTLSIAQSSRGPTMLTCTSPVHPRANHVNVHPDITHFPEHPWPIMLTSTQTSGSIMFQCIQTSFILQSIRGPTMLTCFGKGFPGCYASSIRFFWGCMMCSFISGGVDPGFFGSFGKVR